MSRRAGPSRQDVLLQKRTKTVISEDKDDGGDDLNKESNEGVKSIVVAEDNISEDDERGEVDVEAASDEDLSSESSSEEEAVAKNYEPKTFLAHPYKPYDKLAVEYFNGHKVSKEAKILVESGNKGFYGIKKGKFSLNKFFEWLDEGTNQMVRGYVGGAGGGNWMGEEIGCIVIFGTLSFDQLLATEYEAKYKKEFSEAMQLVWGEIPTDVPIITCFGSGVIANVPKEDPRRLGIVQSTLELESDKLPFLTGMVIPKVEGLGIKNFVVTEEQCKRLNKGKLTLKRCKEMLGIASAKEKDLKGIVFFHSYVDKWTENYNDSPAVKALHTYLEANPHVAMAGGIHQTLLSSGTADEDVVACGFLIYGKDNRIRVSCAALTEPEMSIGNKLKFNKFKTTLMVPENENEDVSSFALMFGCSERGIRMHGRAHVESQYFNEIFPRTRLVGGFDLGEFYREILVHHPKSVTLSPPEQIHFIHVSAFLLVSYRHPKE